MCAIYAMLTIKASKLINLHISVSRQYANTLRVSRLQSHLLITINFSWKKKLKSFLCTEPTELWLNSSQSMHKLSWCWKSQLCECFVLLHLAHSTATALVRQQVNVTVKVRVCPRLLVPDPHWYATSVSRPGYFPSTWLTSLILVQQCCSDTGPGSRPL